MAFYLLYSLREWEILNYQRHLLKSIMEHHLAKKCLLAPPGIMWHWRVVPTGEKGPIAEDDKVCAIGIDVEVGEYNIAKEIIAQIYAVGTTNFPGGLKARALLDPWMLTNAATKEWFGYLRNHQAHFIEGVKKMRTTEIASLDHPFVDQSGHKAQCESE